MKIIYLLQLVKFKFKYPLTKFYRSSRLDTAFSQEGQDILIEKLLKKNFNSEDVIFDVDVIIRLSIQILLYLNINIHVKYLQLTLLIFSLQNG